MRWETKATHLAALAGNEACDRLSISSFVLDGVLWQGFAVAGDPDLVALELHDDWGDGRVFAGAVLTTVVVCVGRWVE